jgi:transcriptional regulator with XRE-family HTH domain
MREKKMIKNAPHAVDVTVGHNVRTLRVQRNVSQEKLGEALGVTFQQVQKYEKGSNRISSSKLSLIAKFFQVDVATLFSGTAENGAGETLFPFSPEALAIAQTYDSIPSAKVRQAIRGLIRTLQIDQEAVER